MGRCVVSRCVVGRCAVGREAVGRGVMGRCVVGRGAVGKGALGGLSTLAGVVNTYIDLLVSPFPLLPAACMCSV